MSVCAYICMHVCSAYVCLFIRVYTDMCTCIVAEPVSARATQPKPSMFQVITYATPF